MTEGMTCYERDETLCEDQMCLRTGCRLRNEGPARSSSGSGEVLWARVNDEPFEYAIQKGQHGDEFVRLLNGWFLHRPIAPAHGSRESGIKECAALMRRWADDAADFHDDRSKIQHNVCRNAALALSNLAETFPSSSEVGEWPK